MREYRFDLCAWLRGEDETPFIGVIGLLRGLPDSSSFKAHWFESLFDRFGGDVEDVPDDRSDDEQEFDARVASRETWGPTAQHLAMIVNAVRANSALWTRSEKDVRAKRRAFDVYGPRDWWPEDQVSEFEKKDKKKGELESPGKTAHEFMSSLMGMVSQGGFDSE